MTAKPQTIFSFSEPKLLQPADLTLVVPGNQGLVSSDAVAPRSEEEASVAGALVAPAPTRSLLLAKIVAHLNQQIEAERISQQAMAAFEVGRDD